MLSWGNHFSYADAYNNEDPNCPHETGQTWGYWNGYDWVDAGAGLAVKCSGGEGGGGSGKIWPVMTIIITC